MRIDIAQGYALPLIWNNEITKRFNDKKLMLLNQRYACPMALKLESESLWYKLPLDPVISISGGNQIIKKNVLKTAANIAYRGTVKELWSQNDYTIKIAGMFQGDNDYTFPEEDLRIIRRICEARESIDVQCDMLLYFGISKIAIEKYDFPFTAGKSNQQFTISAISDDFSINELILD